MDRRESLEFVQVCVASGLSEAFSEGISGNFQLCDLKWIFYLIDNPNYKSQVLPKSHSPIIINQTVWKHVWSKWTLKFPDQNKMFWVMFLTLLKFFVLLKFFPFTKKWWNYIWPAGSDRQWPWWTWSGGMRYGLRGPGGGRLGQCGSQVGNGALSLDTPTETYKDVKVK